MESRDVVGFNKEIGILLESKVKVQLKHRDNFFVVGLLKGFSKSDSIFLKDAKDTIGNAYDKLVIHGSDWLMISLEGTPFPMEGLYQRLKNVIPGGTVAYKPEIGAISIMGGKITVTETGVTGDGPLFDRVKQIYKQYIDDMASQ